ncbi:hypothetical protein [Novosphingobium kaempferiae]|uniref:hypothetical protein n=1 Tax=Novosphingobium kaempferiae TaxID=2896849 RepID=UPI001E445ABC|nr:hypothetical protein [Novosphingobium kaempferiae]
MTLRLFAFILWIAMILAGCASASYYAWSPYSDEDQSLYARGGGSRGPTHK